MGIIVSGRDVGGPPGLAVNTYAIAPGAVARFKNQPRPAGQLVTEVVVHETVTTSWASTVAVLKARGLGVHFIVDERGVAYQHADLQTDEMWHASQHNPMSVGIETVNPYEPSLAPKEGPWQDSIKASWAAGGAYLLPTAAQAESVYLLVGWLASEASGLNIPQLWPGLSGSALAMSRVAACKTPPAPGILSHTYWDHADGPWLVLYSWLRIEAGLSAPGAFAAAKTLATGTVSSADLSAYFRTSPDGQAGYPVSAPPDEPHS